MQLTRYTDYALRVLLYVGNAQPRKVTIAEIANFYDISHEHLRKVVHHLGNSEMVTTSRGKGGGLVLARPAHQINIAQVVQEMEGDLAIVDCAGRECILIGHCSLKNALMQAQRAFLQTLQRHTLADLLASTKLRGRFKQALAAA